MARNKESLILLLDVGPQIHRYLQEIINACTKLVQKKLIYSRNDEVGIIIFGTKETDNELMREVGGYENVVVLRKIDVVNGNLIDDLKHLPHGTAPADFLDAIVVGMDMLIKKFGQTNKGKKRLCLFTSAQCHIKDPNQGAKEDQVHTIAEQMGVHGMKMDCVVVGEMQCSESERNIVDENIVLLNIFSMKTCTRTVHIGTPTSIRGALRMKNTLPVTVFRGDLEFSTNLKIKVWVYKKTSEEKFPRLKKYSDRAHTSDRFATHEVKVDFEYKSFRDPSKLVPPEQRIKGYRYGPQIIPISSVEWEASKFGPEKGIKILGFTDLSNIPRHFYMKDVNAIISEPGNTQGVIAVSAIARSMKEMKKVAIIRCVWKKGQANVVIGVLTPNISDTDDFPDFFYFNVLPFCEDIREFKFPSFHRLPSSLHPSDEQQSAMDNLVETLHLSLGDEDDILPPNFTPNPLLERFFWSLEEKWRDRNSAMPLLDEKVKRITEPDPELFSENGDVVRTFKNQFEIQENLKLKKGSGRPRVREKLPIGEENCGSDDKASDVMQSPSFASIFEIGDSTPARDFETIISRRDNPGCSLKLIKCMSDKIFDMVEDSYMGDNYEKALECMVALRNGCIIWQEPNLFNKFVSTLTRFCEENHLTGFCKLLEDKGVRLITKSEAPASDARGDISQNI